MSFLRIACFELNEMYNINTIQSACNSLRGLLFCVFLYLCTYLRLYCSARKEIGTPVRLQYSHLTLMLQVLILAFTDFIIKRYI